MISKRAKHGCRTPLALCLLTGLLAGCAPADMSDLETYTQQVLARPGGRIEPLPELKPYERYLYQSADAKARDPFMGAEEEAKATPKPTEADPKQLALLAEINNRNREELENYELDSLRMVGTLQDKADLWGIILDKSGTVHRVKVGNYMGKNFGKILSINEEKIDLREIIGDGQGGYEERDATVALSEQ